MTAEVLLKTKGLTKKFRGFTVLENINFTLKEGELHAIIGPNGAGKTTLFNLIIGKIKPTKGEIFFKNENIVGMKPYEISRKGIGVAFQLTNLFQELTVYENIWVSVCSNFRLRWNPIIKADEAREIKEKTMEICEELGLTNKIGVKAKKLSYGDQKILEIALALANNPILLLLDEPVSGLGSNDAENVLKIIKQLHREKRTILLIEHNIDAVKEITNTFSVLINGKILATGSLSSILSLEEVRKVYLGA